MLKGKHIIITLLIIGLLWLNWFAYSTFQQISNDKLIGTEDRVKFCVILMVIQGISLLLAILINIDKLWNWEFNLNKWLCKLEH